MCKVILKTGNGPGCFKPQTQHYLPARYNIPPFLINSLFRPTTKIGYSCSVSRTYRKKIIMHELKKQVLSTMWLLILLLNINQDINKILNKRKLKNINALLKIK